MSVTLEASEPGRINTSAATPGIQITCGLYRAGQATASIATSPHRSRVTRRFGRGFLCGMGCSVEIVQAQAAATYWVNTTLIHPLAGGHRNEVWLCRSSRGFTVLRRSSRTSVQLEWEFDLLRHLQRSGVAVPQVIATSNGSAHVNGWHLLTYIEGQVLQNENDERLVASLSKVHNCTVGWPQRPGFLASSDLLTMDRGGDIDLGLMPPDLVAAMRDAWRTAASLRLGVVHGDAGPGNAVLTPDGTCVLIDWDESRVDDPIFDLGLRPQAARARLAWEIATCWTTEHDYATGLIPAFLAE